MQFTKDDACQELTKQLSQKFENIESWERTIKENVEHVFDLISDNETITLEDFCTKVIPIFQTTAGHIRKSNADVAKTLQSEIESLKKAKGEEKPAIQSDNSDNDEIKALKERLNALETERTERELNGIKNSKRDEIKRLIKESKVESEDFINEMVSRTNVDKDTDCESEAKKIVEFYNKISSSTPKQQTPKSAGSNSEDKYQKDVLGGALKIATESMLK